MLAVANLLGLEDKNPVVVIFSFHPAGHYSAKLNTFLPLHVSPTLSSQVPKEAHLSLKPSDRALSIFLTCTHFQSTFPSLSSVQSLEEIWCLGVWD